MAEDSIPNLGGLATDDAVLTKGGGFKAKYITWARTLADIRKAAPGWMPAFVPNENRGMPHRAPNGSAYLLIFWQHPDGRATTPIPHAIMDQRMNAASGDDISSRDLADGFLRGACKSAAAGFGYAWELWGKEEMGAAEPVPGEDEAETDDEFGTVPAPKKPAGKKRRAAKPAPEPEEAFEPRKEIRATPAVEGDRREVEIEVDRVTRNEGEKNGRKFTRYLIHSVAGDEHSTFDLNVAEMAAHVQKSGGKLIMVLEQKGRFENLIEARPAAEEEEECPF